MTKYSEVLIIDDSQTSLYLMKLWLQDMRLTDKISTALNGEEAFEYLFRLKAEGKELPQIIFLDLNMPVMDGFEFLEEWQKLEVFSMEETRIVVVTSSTHSYDLLRVQELGVNSCLTKPVTADSIWFALNTFQGQ